MMNRSTDAFCSIISTTQVFAVVQNKRLNSRTLDYTEKSLAPEGCGFLQRCKNCTVYNLYWLWTKMLSWKPPSSDSKEGQLEFSPKCIKFSTKCYTDNINFFLLFIFLLKSKSLQSWKDDKKPTQRNYADTRTTQGHQRHHHFLSEGRLIDCIFTIHI